MIAPSARASEGTRPGGLIGLEHEFVVRDHDRVIDFRELIRDLPLGGRSLDPGDVNARRCDWGGVVTADGAEAEVAVPPLPRRPGFTARLERSAVRAREALRGALPAGLDLTGYSTHLSLSMPASLNAAACRLFLSTFAPGLMLLADRADSPGLLVRPRPGRMELATEYVSGSRLHAVAAYAAGGAIAAASAATAQGVRPMLPPPVRAHSIVTGDRFGWGLARDAFGTDLLSEGRRTLLRRTNGRTIRAQDHLELSWGAARAALAGGARPADLEPADAMVSGRSPLAIEGAGDADDAAVAAMRWPATPYGGLLRPRERTGFSVSAEIATWDTAVFAITGLWRRAFASVPRASLPRFLSALDRGELDTVIRTYVDGPPAGRALASWSDAIRPGLFDALGPARLLLAAESPTPGVSIREMEDRYGKFVPPVVNEGRTTAFLPGMSGLPWLPIGIVIGLLALGGIVVALSGGGGKTVPPPSPAASNPAVAPSASATGTGPRIALFRAVLLPPTTTYTVEVVNPGGSSLTYTWTANVSCPGFRPSTGPSAVWDHPHPPCPTEQVHPGTITVLVRDTAGRSATYTYAGGSGPAEIRLDDAGAGPAAPASPCEWVPQAGVEAILGKRVTMSGVPLQCSVNVVDPPASFGQTGRLRSIAIVLEPRQPTPSESVVVIEKNGRILSFSSNSTYSRTEHPEGALPLLRQIAELVRARLP